MLKLNPERQLVCPGTVIGTISFCPNLQSKKVCYLLSIFWWGFTAIENLATLPGLKVSEALGLWLDDQSKWLNSFESSIQLSLALYNVQLLTCLAFLPQTASVQQYLETNFTEHENFGFWSNCLNRNPISSCWDQLLHHRKGGNHSATRTINNPELWVTLVPNCQNPSYFAGILKVLVDSQLVSIGLKLSFSLHIRFSFQHKT